MVKITERVVNTYFARLFFSKVMKSTNLIFLRKYSNFRIFPLYVIFQGSYYLQAGENDILSVDARPSDAINVANRCKVYNPLHLPPWIS